MLKISINKIAEDLDNILMALLNTLMLKLMKLLK